MIVRATLAFLGLVGMLISLYFTLVYYGKMRADAPFIPRVCRLGDADCRALIHRPEARLLGLPNFVVGLCYYAALVAFAGTPAGAAPLAGRALVWASGAAVAFGAVLSAILIVRLRTNCVLCFASHVINACIFVALLVRGSG